MNLYIQMRLKSKRKKSIKGVDYGFATQRAREFIQEYNIDWLPVDIFEIASSMDIKIKTIEDLSFETGLDRQTLVDEIIYGEDGLAILNPDENRYTIVINEDIEPFGRIRWTIAHEIAHVVLEHLHSGRTSILRWELSDEEYDEMEQEAHIFAGEVLAPKFILYRIGAHASAEIEDICELSKAASRSRETAINELINDKSKMHDSMLNIIPTFAKYLEFKTICCLSEKLRIQSRLQTNPVGKRQTAPLELSIAVSGKFSTCPKCGNSNISREATFCKLCGELLFETVPVSLPNSPCGLLGDKDACFCENCGHVVYKTRFGLHNEK